ncbi:MAG: AAA family ATPase [Acidimicrobiales bacterium]|nr:AAA family ATPase [Acidimicrobiales bacterium]
MKIKSLNLTHFGKFKSLTLPFSEESINIVFGENEAGKSTCRHSINRLLYGLVKNDPFDFSSINIPLDISGELIDDHGAILKVSRQKKPGSSFMYGDGNVINEAEWMSLLHGITSQVYSNLFSISQEEISTGGAMLLDSKGDVGKILYGARTGNPHIYAAIQQLQGEASEIYTARGKTRKLNELSKNLKDLQSKIKDLSVIPSEYKALISDLDKSREELAGLVDEINRLSSRMSLLARAQVGLPVVAKRDKLIQDINAIESLGVMQDIGRSEKYFIQRDIRDGSETQIKIIGDQLSSLKSQLDKISVDPVILEVGNVIEELNEEQGEYKKNLQDLPARLNEAQQHEANLKHSLDFIGLSWDSNWQALVKDLQIGRLDSFISEASLQMASIRDEEVAISTLESQLASIDDLGGVEIDEVNLATLESTLARVQKEGDIESRISEIASQISTNAGEINSVLSRTNCKVLPHELYLANIPRLDQIRDSKIALEASEQNVSVAEHSIETLNEEITNFNMDLSELIDSGSPPSKSDLLHKRTRRDEILVEVFSSSIDDTMPPKYSIDDLRNAIDETDALADLLFENAATVTKIESINRSIEEIKVELGKVHQALTEAKSKQQTALLSFNLIWDGLLSTPPEASHVEEVYFSLDTASKNSKLLNLQNLEKSQLEDRHASLLSDLKLVLKSIGALFDENSTLSLLADFALHHLEKIREELSTLKNRLAEKERITTALKQRQSHLLQTREAYELFNSNNLSLLSDFGFPSNAKLGELDKTLGELKEIRNENDKFEVLKKRIEGINQRNEDYVRRVNELASKCIEQYNPEEPIITVAAMYAKLKYATSARDRADALKASVEQSELTLREITIHFDEAYARIQEILSLENCQNESELEALIRRSVQLEELKNTLEAITTQLYTQTNTSIDQIIQECASLVGIDISHELQELKEKSADLDVRRDDLVKHIHDLEHQIDSSLTRQSAADAEQEFQLKLVEVRNYMERYLGLEIARAVLEKEVERFRRENQEPLLENAGKYFSIITDGEYSSIEGFQSGNTIELMAISKEGEKKTPAMLSSGTKDQLYLSIRLSALSRFIKIFGPLPVIVDDIFVNFDDKRAALAFKALEELAKNTQVIVFTHHETTVNGAKSMLKDHIPNVIQI